MHIGQDELENYFRDPPPFALIITCMDGIIRSLSLTDIPPHRGPLRALFGFASRGGVVRTTDGLCCPSCLLAVPHGLRGAAFSTESPTFCRILGLLGLGAEHEPALHRSYCALCFFAPLFYSVERTSPLLKSNGLSHRGGILRQ